MPAGEWWLAARLFPATRQAPSSDSQSERMPVRPRWDLRSVNPKDAHESGRASSLGGLKATLRNLPVGRRYGDLPRGENVPGNLAGASGKTRRVTQRVPFGTAKVPVRSSEGWRRGFPETGQHSPGRRSAPGGPPVWAELVGAPVRIPASPNRFPLVTQQGQSGPPSGIRRGGGAGDGGKIGGRVLTGPGRGWPVTGRRPDGGEDLLAGRLESGRSTPARRLA